MIGIATAPANPVAFGLMRGGSWESAPQYCRSASRSRFSPDNRSRDNGFRVVQVARIQ